MTTTRIYDLSIRNIGKRKVPELVFTPLFAAHKEIWQLIRQELLGSEANQLSFLPEPMTCGPSQCVQYEDGEQPRFIIRLTPNLDPHELARIVDETLWSLGAVAFKQDIATNRVMLADLNLRCELTRDMHGYSIGGYLHESFLQWLGGEAKRDNKAQQSLMRKVIAAMWATWYATAPEDQREYYEDCNFRILEDGRFMFNCFGNSCDMSLYPDQLGIDPIGNHVFLSFGCHNVDHPWQQLTLLAGFAVLLEAVRRDVDVI